MLYHHEFKNDYMTGTLSVPGIRDRGYVLINEVISLSSNPLLICPWNISCLYVLSVFLPVENRAVKINTLRN